MNDNLEHDHTVIHCGRLEIALQVVDELRLQHEDVGLYELAAALDLVGDRLGVARVRH